MNNVPYFLALNRIQRVGPKITARLYQRWPELHSLFQSTVAELEQAGLPLWLAQAINSFDMAGIEEDLKWLHASSDHHLLTWDSPEYPALLKEIADPPPVLYAKGQLSCLEPAKLAMVGTRNPSPQGSENAFYFAKELAGYGMVIVSGLALGIDAQAHKGCLAADGQTIAVLGTGLDCIYPYRHQELAHKISEKGLLLSEFPLKSPPTAGHFPRRNRIISGLSLSTLVVEAAIKSGSLITARMALEQNRDVLAIPGSIHNPLARGCHYLLQQGAKLVVTVKDILDEFTTTNPITKQFASTSELSMRANFKKSENALANSAQNLVKFMDFETTSIDQLIMRSGYSMDQVIGELAELEIMGIVQAIPGGYVRCDYER